MSSNVYSFLGLIQKAGKLVSGDDAVEIDVKKKKSYLVIIASDASENTKKKFINMCEHRRIKYIMYGKKADIGYAIGKSERSVVSVKDPNFSEGLLKKISTEYNGGESFVNN